MFLLFACRGEINTRLLVWLVSVPCGTVKIKGKGMRKKKRVGSLSEILVIFSSSLLDQYQK